MFATYLIGLREGLEAGLVVCMLTAYLGRTENRSTLRRVWLGVGIAVVAAAALGIALPLGSARLTYETQQTLDGAMLFLAVALVTWLVLRMCRTVHRPSAEPLGKRQRALVVGVAGLVLTVFLAVGREGGETALFLWSAVRLADGGAGAFTGVVLGLITAVAVSWMLHRGAVRADFETFLRWAGALLIVVAAGALAIGVHDFQEVGILPGVDYRLLTVDTTPRPDSWYGTLLRGVFGFQANPTELQAACWTAYVVPFAFLVLRPAGPRPSTRATA
ncbi:iron uptake transporter permease EfeU [Streptomyces sp. NPDC048639]|uniref:iron uptake transporter permease EfeU n=1 Tax=Streptomyces sp. NPDC048639 TaxID=3365581 RepID=UPI003723D341